MAYGHDPVHPASGAATAQPRKPASGGAWRDLDPNRRLAMIERALGHASVAA